MENKIEQALKTVSLKERLEALGLDNTAEDLQKLVTADVELRKAIESYSKENKINTKYITMEKVEGLDLSSDAYLVFLSYVAYQKQLEDAKEIKEDEEDKNMEESSFVDSSVKAYLKEIGQYELLTPEEEIELVKRASEGDLEAKERMIKCNLRLVVNVAKRYTGSGMPLLDLIQEGNIGLMKALEKYDYTKGFKFSTYATWWIRQGITRSIADQSRTIRIPVHANEEVNKIRKVMHQYMIEFGRVPTDREIAKAIRLDVNKVAYLKRMSETPTSLDVPIGDEKDVELKEFIRDDVNPTVEDQAFLPLLRRDLEIAMEALTDREREILKLRFGLITGEIMTLEDVGNMYGVTRERIRQIESKALRKLRIPRRSQKLREYLKEL